MEKKIILVDADRKHRCGLSRLLEEDSYRTVPLHSIHILEKSLRERDCLAVIIDIDTVQVDSSHIRDLTIKYPEVYFFSLSSETFHPELKEAICCHIYACMKKPVDPDELFYWLGSIKE